MLSVSVRTERKTLACVIWPRLLSLDCGNQITKQEETKSAFCFIDALNTTVNTLAFLIISIQVCKHLKNIEIVQPHKKWQLKYGAEDSKGEQLFVQYSIKE